MKNIFILPIFILLAINSTAFAQALQPGLWKTKSVFTVSGITLPSSNGEDCVTAEEAKDIKLTITKELKKNGCNLDSWKIKNSHLDAALTCKNDQLDAKGALSGIYTSKSYSLSGKANGVIQGSLPASAEIQLVGTWSKECTH